MPKSSTPNAIYLLKISLRHIRPPIWRRLLVPDTMLLNELHRLIQAAMPWFGGHLYCFTINGQEYAEPNEFDDFGLPPSFDDRTRRLCDVVPGAKFKFYQDSSPYSSPS